MVIPLILLVLRVSILWHQSERGRTLTMRNDPPSIAGQTQNLAATHRFLSGGEGQRENSPLYQVRAA
jgi:hypothetical protein